MSNNNPYNAPNRPFVADKGPRARVQISHFEICENEGSFLGVPRMKIIVSEGSKAETPMLGLL